MKAPIEFISKFSETRVLVVGDVMLDRYIHGSVERISPEAPVPVVKHENSHAVPGGAANAAANISALGAHCTLIGRIGDDFAGQELAAACHKRNINLALLKNNEPTIEKTRIIGNHQQIVRIDKETTGEPNESTNAELCARLRDEAPNHHVVIVCDYAKGVITEELIACIQEIRASHSLPVLADVKPAHKSLYRNLDYLTPNRSELSGLVYETVKTVADAHTWGTQLVNELEVNLLVTLSEHGLLLVPRHGKPCHLPTRAQQVSDVSGAGDTVIATFALALGSGADPEIAAAIANHAASVVVGKLGTATLSVDELLASFK